MSDYTPTTTDILNAWSRHSAGVYCEGCAAEFFRWFNNIRAAAWDEGFYAGADYPQRGRDGEWEMVANPYQRSEQE